MELERKLTVNEKALMVNLDPNVYGSFSEIGAGQEVAANFFQAGGASGTIALTQSAYDKKISNAIYGEGKRFVSKQRLIRMMDHDFANITEKLADREEDTSFFAFADTIETLNFHKTNQGQGWMGITFQRTPQTKPNQIVLHVILHDNDPLLQQKAIGRLGVNLIHGVYNNIQSMKVFLSSLMDGLSRDRVEIDMFNVKGPDFENVDNRLISLKLVKLGLTPVAMFGPDGQNVQASEILYKKNLLVLRGRFRPPTLVNVDMLLAGYRQFVKDSAVSKKDLIVLSELSLNNLLMGDDHKKERDYMDRVDILCSLGQTVIITNYQHYYRLTNYLSDVNRGRKIGVLMGVNNLEAIFDPVYYSKLKGGILESFGRLFGRNIKLLIYPATDGQDGELHTCDNVQIDQKLKHLFYYLVENDQIEDITSCNKDLLSIYSDDVLEMIHGNKSGWEKLVPNKVARTIKKNGMFGYISNN
ncbi:MAG: TonB-dependent receptor [Salibacteraceae bacterium]